MSSATRTIDSRSARPGADVVERHARQRDRHFLGLRQVIEAGHDVPAVHLSLVHGLGAVVEAGRIAESERVGGREEPERRVRRDHPVLVEQRETPFQFQHPLDHEHHVRAPGVVLIEDQRSRGLDRPRQQSLAKLGHLPAVAQHDRVAPDQVRAADVAVEVDPQAGPVEPGGHLFDMRGLAGAVKALHHHAAVVRKPGQDRERGVRVETVDGVERRDVLGAVSRRPARTNRCRCRIARARTPRNPAFAHPHRGTGAHSRYSCSSMPGMVGSW